MALSQHQDGGETQRGGDRPNPDYGSVLAPPGSGVLHVTDNHGLDARSGDERCRVLGVPFRPGTTHVMAFGPVRVAETTHLFSLIHLSP